MAEDLTEFYSELGCGFDTFTPTSTRSTASRSWRLRLAIRRPRGNQPVAGASFARGVAGRHSDADKEGFLRAGATAETIGRAARNVRGKVIMYTTEDGFDGEGHQRHP